MGATQTSFLTDFTLAFDVRFGHKARWEGGQHADNCAAFASPYPCRRPGGARTTERFELGDATTSFRGWKVIIEFEAKELPISNVLKYWPYLRGELNSSPISPVLLCHFSDWWSYATRRDLWEWTVQRMSTDPGRLVDIQGRQFDHGGSDSSLRQVGIASALAWIESVTPAALLLNIDKPHRTATLHREGCPTIPHPVGTSFKPVGKLGRDGGWFMVVSESSARSVAQREFSRGDFIRCQHC